MANFIKITNKAGQKVIVNTDYIVTIQPVENDWRKGTLVKMQDGSSFYLEPIEGDNLRSALGLQ